MKKSNAAKRSHHDASQLLAPPDKVGWIRKFCGKGIFREIWRNRFVILRGDQLYISEKEVKDERKVQEVFDLLDYERSEELRKAKSRSKKNHSRFTLLRCRQPGNMVPNLVFLAVSPEEKESWVNALNLAIIKAKNRILDEVTIEQDSVLVHPTRDRARIPHARRLPTRGHLMAVASTSSNGMLTLDLVHEEDGFMHDYDPDQWLRSFQAGVAAGSGVSGGRGRGRQRSGTDVSKLRVTSREPKVKTGSLPRGSERSWGKQPHLEGPQHHQQNQHQQAQSSTPQPGKRLSAQGRSRCQSMDEVVSSRPCVLGSEFRSGTAPHRHRAGCGPTRPDEDPEGPEPSQQPVGQLQSLIAQKMQRAQELLEEMRLQELRERGGGFGGGGGGGGEYMKSVDSPRLHHLRGHSESPHSRTSATPRSRSSDSPRLRGKDSPRLRGKDSPRSKGKKSRSKGTDLGHSKGTNSPHSKGTNSPHSKGSNSHSKGSDSPHSKGNDSPHSKGNDSPHSKGNDSPHSKGSDSSHSKGSDSPCSKGNDSPHSKGNDSPNSNRTDSPHSKGFNSPVLKVTNTTRLKLTDSSRFKETGSFDSPHLNRETESPLCKSSESSPCLRGIDSPQLRGADSSRSSETDSPPLLKSNKESPPSSLTSKDSLALRSTDSPKVKGSNSFDSYDSPRTYNPNLLLLSSPPSSLLSYPSPGEEEEEGGDVTVERRRAEAERLLEEAVSSWKQAQEVLEEVKELQTQTLRRRRRGKTTPMTSPTRSPPALEEDTPPSATSQDEDESEPA
ncbi:pleckstrin homology domain-containing family O member 1-A [Aplochiton taeniatus]